MYSARKKNIASIEKLTMKATTFAPRKLRERKNEKSTIGTRARRSATTKPTRQIAATAKSERIRVESQPQLLPWTSARTSAASPQPSVSTPGTSTTRSTVSSRDSGAAASVTTTARAATGRLRKKIDCQETFSTR